MESLNTTTEQITYVLKENGSFNNTDQDFTTDEYDVSAIKIIIPTLFTIITVIGTIGSCLVIYTLVFKKNSKKQMILNGLLVNLAVADLLFIIICVPVAAAYRVMENWPFGDAMCKLLHFLKEFSAYMSIYSLVAISVTRYFTIVRARFSGNIPSQHRMYTLFVYMGLWVIVPLVNIPNLFIFGTKKFRPHLYGRVYTLCGSIYPEANKKKMLCFLVFSYILPVTIVSVTHFLIVRHINKNSADVTPGSIRRRRNANRIIIATTTGFAVCWLPIQLYVILSSCLPIHVIYTSEAFAIFGIVAEVLAYSNSCINPIIYNFVSEDFRKDFIENVCAKCFYSNRTILVSKTSDTSNR
ncbi:unnamed protein product, partial [Owenia fusiformis]